MKIKSPNETGKQNDVEHQRLGLIIELSSSKASDGRSIWFLVVCIASSSRVLIRPSVSRPGAEGTSHPIDHNFPELE